jgi:hypothetical protein
MSKSEEIHSEYRLISADEFEAFRRAKFTTHMCERMQSRGISEGAIDHMRSKCFFLGRVYKSAYEPDAAFGVSGVLEMIEAEARPNSRETTRYQLRITEAHRQDHEDLVSQVLPLRSKNVLISSCKEDAGKPQLSNDPEDWRLLVGKRLRASVKRSAEVDGAVSVLKVIKQDDMRRFGDLLANKLIVSKHYEERNGPPQLVLVTSFDFSVLVTVFFHDELHEKCAHVLQDLAQDWQPDTSAERVAEFRKTKRRLPRYLFPSDSTAVTYSKPREEPIGTIDKFLAMLDWEVDRFSSRKKYWMS